MRIHVAARNEAYAQQFAKNNPGAQNVILHRASSSLFTLLQSIIDGDDDYALFVHDDVFLPYSMNDYVLALIEELNTNWPNWGICGNAGITTPTLAGGGRVCRFLFDPHGGPSLGGFILPAETVDGNTILINCRALREADVRLPSFEGFQFYDISLSVETLAAGLAALLAPQLACYHNSKGNQSEFDRAFKSKSLNEYLANRLSNRYVNTLNGTLSLPFTAKKRGQFDICTTALRNAALGRPDAKIAFVIRSQFRDLSLLSRAITSTLAFAAATQNNSIRTYVITENSDHKALSVFSDKISIIQSKHTASADTRNILIRDAIKSITEDFVLFLDDDDWVFPNEAGYISDLLGCLPDTASLIVESQHFSEAITVPGETDWRNSTLRPQRRFLSTDWPMNFTGNNYIPMCGAFYSRKILMDQPPETYENIVYYEDYAASIFALLNVNSLFFSAPKLISGISIRDIGSSVSNTVTVADRTKWNQSQAELAHHLCANKTNNVAYSIGEAFASRGSRHSSGSVVGQQNVHLSWLDRKSIACTRFIHGLIICIISPCHYAYILKRLVNALKSGGAREAFRSIVDMRDISN